MRGCRPFDLLNNCGSITVRQASKPLLKQPQLNKNMVISIESNAVEPLRLFKLIFGKGLTEKIGVLGKNSMRNNQQIRTLEKEPFFEYNQTWMERANK